MKNGSQPSIFVLVAADADPRLRSEPSAHTLAVRRLEERLWGLNFGTRNLHTMRPGDRILAYASGRRENGRSFVGYATVSKVPQPISNAYERRVLFNIRCHLCPFIVPLTRVRVFSRPVLIEPLLTALSFIRSPRTRYWSAPLMGGSLRISLSDFCKVLKVAGLSSAAAGLTR